MVLIRLAVFDYQRLFIQESSSVNSRRTLVLQCIWPRSLLMLLSDTHCWLLFCCNAFRSLEIDCGIIYRKLAVFYFVSIFFYFKSPQR